MAPAGLFLQPPLTVLCLVHFVIKSLLFHQLLMISALHHVSVPHHQDAVGVPDGGKPVSHDEAGFVSHEAPHGSLDLMFRPGVHVGSGLV